MVDINENIRYNRFMFEKKEKTTNAEIYSFLNIVSRPLGKLYKLTGYSPLPDDFVLTEEVVEEALFLSEMRDEDIVPPFAYENKDKFKKILKKSATFCKKLAINVHEFGFSEDFCEKLRTYLLMRYELTQQILKSSKSQSFDEISAFREIHNLNPVFAELMEFGENEEVGLYGEKLQPILEGLEEKYLSSYEEKKKAVEKKNARQKKELAERLSAQSLEESKKRGKIAQKNATAKQKIEKKKAVEKTREEMKTARANDKSARLENAKKTK